MLQYTVQDLIEQAKNKADLENSDFIRHSENISVLNDCWTGLYQKAIDAGEKFFIVSVMLEGNGCYQLPDDFFQLASVTEKNGVQIPRRTTSEIERGFKGYEIRNNKIYVFNTNAEVRLEYYPVPATLTFPFAPVKFSLSETFKAGRKNLVFSDNKCFNLNTNEINSITGIDEDCELFQVYKNFVCFIKYKSVDRLLTNATYYYVDYQTLTVEYTVDSDSLIVAMQNNEGTEIYLNVENGTIYSLDGIAQTSVENIPENVSKNMVLNSDETITVLEGYSSFWINDNLFYTDNKNKIHVYHEETKTTEDGRFDSKGFLLEYNELNGRGIWFNNTLFSSSSNVLLNYPNNLFFSVLMYELAISYKIKQNQDTTVLESKKTEIEYQYFDSLTQDDFEPVRIRNVYY